MPLYKVIDTPFQPEREELCIIYQVLYIYMHVTNRAIDQFYFLPLSHNHDNIL